MAKAFLLYVEQALVPTLLPCEIVVMDDLGSHKSQGVRKAIRAVWRQSLVPAGLFTRPQSDRTGFSKLKHVFLIAGERSVEGDESELYSNASAQPNAATISSIPATFHPKMITL